MGGVIVDQKYERGEYLIVLREDRSSWVETNALLYYANLAKPWIMIPVMIFLVVSVGLKEYIKIVKWTRSK